MKKNNKTLKRNLEFFYELGCIRYVQRVWKQFLNADFANLSEHIFRVTWIAMVIAKEEEKQGQSIDWAKLVKMALVHDLSESRSVDVHYLSRQYADRKEHTAIKDMLADTSLEKEFVQLWEQYEQRTCLESKIIKDADNLDVDLELKEQSARGFQLEKDWAKMRQHVAENKLYTKTAKQIWTKISSSNPNDWHINARNRFNAGDWKK